jgi:glyoxylase-like metal-dependent hydrolase (beta-lactamase superfamily II)
MPQDVALRQLPYLSGKAGKGQSAPRSNIMIGTLPLILAGTLTQALPAPPPTWRLTGVLLIDQPPKAFGFSLQGRAEGDRTVATHVSLGSWDPRTRITGHATLPVSRAGWHLHTGVHDWLVPEAEQLRFRHHVFLVDRPVYHQPEGKEKERVLHLALSSDRVTPGSKVLVQWRWRGSKGLEPSKAASPAAFLQQTPTSADDSAGWTPLRLEPAKDGEATLQLPASLKPGLAWLRVGLADRPARATARLLAELPLVVAEGHATPAPPAPAPALQDVRIGTPLPQSKVPGPWRQGVFLQPQSVSAVDVSNDGRHVGVTTMAFRHDRNFWLLSGDGKVQWGRYVQPWAPYQAAVLPGAKAFAVGLAYSRFTDPSPTVSLFQGEKAEETALVDSIWNMGWLRYGHGDWRTGWPVSTVGDLVVRGHGSVFTTFSHDGAWRLAGDGRRERYPLLYQRPFRMSASADGHVLAFGYLVPDVSRLDEKTRNRLRLPPALLAVSNALTAARVWTAGPMTDAKPAPPLPEPADDFPDMAEDFNMKPLATVPFRVALSVAQSGDGSRTALTEYGGWLRIKRERGIGGWNPPHHAPFCPRQRGWVRVFGPTGDELARAELPADGLFDVHMNRQGDVLWCAPQSWFARGLAGCSWLPADAVAHSVHVYDLKRMAWTAAWRFPDAVSDLAVHPEGDRVLVSCWDGKAYLMGRDGRGRKQLDVASPARVRWSADGQLAVLGTQAGDVWGLDAGGERRWRTALPVTAVPPPKELLRPVFEGVPIYSVGRVGAEHAYVGDIWLIKTAEGGILVDTAGTSAIPYTWQRLRAAGVEPKHVRYVLLSHSHGDHAGAAYLWRTQGARIVAPATAAFTVTWLMPTWSDYSIWVPAPIDVPLPLKRAGDEKEITLCGLMIKAVFVPGHSFDSVLYALQLNGKRILFTGDIGFEGASHILHRCWGDREKALVVTRVLLKQVLPWRPDHVLTGHGPRPQGTAFLEDLVKRTQEALSK